MPAHKGHMTVAALAALLCAAVGAAPAHGQEIIDDNDVEVSVSVADRYPSGILALTVQSNQTALTEVNTADPTLREFVGALPAVTVTDTRSDVPQTPWYVLGPAADFVSGANVISADHLGWTPSLAEDYGSVVEAGFDVAAVIDDPDSSGLSSPDGELLYVNWDQLDTYEPGSWTATAGLQLRVDAANLSPGTYTSVITLSLFE